MSTTTSSSSTFFVLVAVALKLLQHDLCDRRSDLQLSTHGGQGVDRTAESGVVPPVPLDDAVALLAVILRLGHFQRCVLGFYYIFHPMDLIEISSQLSPQTIATDVLFHT